VKVRVQLRDQPTEYLEELYAAIGEELLFRRNIEPKKPYRERYGPPCDDDPMYECTECGQLEHEPFDSCPKCGRM
jgi:rubrerythrin